MNSSILQAAKHTPASRILYLLPFALVFAVACGESTTGEPTTRGPTTNAVADAYLLDLPPWDEFSPEDPNDEGTRTDKPAETELVPEDGKDYTCTTEQYSMTATPEEIVTLNPNVAELWVGSLLQGSGYAFFGSLQELPIRERAPIAIQVDLLAADNTRTVDNPTAASVNQAIGELVELATAAGHRAGSKIFYNQETAHSVEQGMLKAGFSASYAGVGITSGLETNRKATTSTVMATYTQQMFTVSMVNPQTPGAVFNDAFTEEVLQEQVELNRIGPNNLPVFVSNIVYGRTVVFSITAAGTAEQIKAALEIASGGGLAGVELTTDQSTLLQNSEVQLTSVGGDVANAKAVVKSGDFSSFFDEESALTTAKPLSYTLNNLADNVVAKVSSTLEYDIRTCTAPPAEITGGLYVFSLLTVTPISLPDIDRGNELIEMGLDVNFTSVNGRVDLFERDYVERTDRSYPVFDATYPTPPGNMTPELPIHYDGRDNIIAFGNVWDWDDGNPYDYLPFRRGWQWPDAPLCDSCEAIIDATDDFGNNVRLRFRINRTAYLSD